jgi:hypothetical protein
MPKNVQIKDFSFRAYAGEVTASGSRTIGWCDLTFVLEDTEIEVRDLKLRVNASGKHTLCAPSRRYKNAQGETRTRSAYKFDDGTYGTLVDAIFQSDDVVAALKIEPVAKETISLNA